MAVSRNQINAVQWLLDANADPNIARPDTTTPLYIAKKNKYRDIVKLLLEKNARSVGPPGFIARVFNKMRRTSTGGNRSRVKKTRRGKTRRGKTRRGKTRRGKTHNFKRTLRKVKTKRKQHKN